MSVKEGKALQLFIEREWSVETIRSLGSGFLYHLTYPTYLIEPELLTDLRCGNVPVGTEAQVLMCQNQTLRRIALGELEKINDFGTFIRIDFRILRTNPSLKEIETPATNGYYLRYAP